MVTFNNIKQKLFESKASPLILNFLEVYKPAQEMEMMVMKMSTIMPQEHCPPCWPFFLESASPLNSHYPDEFYSQYPSEASVHHKTPVQVASVQ